MDVTTRVGCVCDEGVSVFVRVGLLEVVFQETQSGEGWGVRP